MFGAIAGAWPARGPFNRSLTIGERAVDTPATAVTATWPRPLDNPYPAAVFLSASAATLGHPPARRMPPVPRSPMSEHDTSAPAAEREDFIREIVNLTVEESPCALP